jgi:hypothetical protein
VDTVRFRWRGDSDTYKEFQRRPEGYVQGYRGEAFTQTKLGRIGVYPDGLVYLEGRAAAILSGDNENHSLLPVHGLSSAERVARIFVQDSGARVPDEVARLGRVDLAAELRFGDPREGSAFLHSLASLDVPWCKSRVDGRKGDHIETVSFHGIRGATIYLRAYDKGVESGTDKVGTRIRVERQKRYRKTRELLPDDFAVTDIRKAYLGREFKLLSDLPSAVVCDLPEALVVLRDRLLPWQQMERLGGYLCFGQWIDYPRMTHYRRLAELRELGIFVDPTQRERIEVPVGQYLQTLASAWAA